MEYLTIMAVWGLVTVLGLHSAEPKPVSQKPALQVPAGFDPCQPIKIAFMVDKMVVYPEGENITPPAKQEVQHGGNTKKETKVVPRLQTPCERT